MSSGTVVDEEFDFLQNALGVGSIFNVLTLPRIAIVAIIFLGACGKPAQSNPKKLRVGFAQIANEGPWREANTKSIKDEAHKRNIDLQFFECENPKLRGKEQQPDQIKALRSFIDNKVDVIAFSPVIEKGWKEVLEEAKKARIPVILMDRGIHKDDESLFATFIGSDFREEGRRAAQWLLREFPNKQAPINVVEIQGTLDSAPATHRTDGFREIAERSRRIKILAWRTGNFTSQGAIEAMSSLLQEVEAKQIDVVFTHSDTMALAAIEELKHAGITPGRDIWVVSIDATKEGRDAIREGTLNCSVECRALLGPQLFDAAEAVAESMALPARTIVDEGVYDKTNVDEGGAARQQ